jgi:hypothetical protein
MVINRDKRYSTLLTLTSLEQTGTIISVCHNEAAGREGSNKLPLQVYIKTGEG